MSAVPSKTWELGIMISPFFPSRIPAFAHVMAVEMIFQGTFCYLPHRASTIHQKHSLGLFSKGVIHHHQNRCSFWPIPSTFYPSKRVSELIALTFYYLHAILDTKLSLCKTCTQAIVSCNIFQDFLTLITFALTTGFMGHCLQWPITVYIP